MSTKIKGSTKMWSIILLVIVMFLNYITWFTDFIPGKPNNEWYHIVILMFTVLSYVPIVVFGVCAFIEYILPNINKWADDTF